MSMERIIMVKRPKRIQYHPACLLFPKLGETELQELADNIKANGLRHPIVLYQGKVLDGRNRLAACKIAKVEPTFVEWDGKGSPLEYVISQNLARRHLTPSQRAVIACDLLPMLEKDAKERQRLSRGRGKKGAQSRDTNSQNGKASAVAARLAHSNATYVETVKAIKKKSPKLVEKIRSGEMTVPEADQVVKNGKNGKKQAKDYWQDHANGKGDSLTLYPTPPHITEALLRREAFDGSILEPASGNGSMSKVLRANGYKVTAKDIKDGHDFFKRRAKADNIVTNPPYSGPMVEKFIRHAFTIARHKIAMLVPFYSLEGMRRHDLYNNKEWPLKAVYIFSRRPVFGDHNKGSSAPFGSCWCVWDRSYTGETKIEWILDSEKRTNGKPQKPKPVKRSKKEADKRLKATELIHGDCRTKLKEIRTSSIDLVLTDPPYPEIKARGKDYPRISETDWHNLMHDVVRESRRVLKPTGSMVVVLQPNYFYCPNSSFGT